MEPTPLRQFTADHRFLLEPAGRQAGFAQPVAFDPDEFTTPMLEAARRGPLLPLGGVLVRDWDPDARRTRPGVCFGLRLYDLDGIAFGWVSADFNSDYYSHGAN